MAHNKINAIYINDGFVKSCHSRESGNPGTCKYLKYWIPAFAGMTNIGVLMAFYSKIINNF